MGSTALWSSAEEASCGYPPTSATRAPPCWPAGVEVGAAARVVGDEPGGGVQADRDRPVVGGCLSRAGESGCRTGASTTAATVAKRRGHRRCMIAASGGG